MKIGLIRHFPVQHKYLTGWVSQSQVLQWFQGYNEADLQTWPVDTGTSWDQCYSSQLPRARKTAEAIYQGEIITTPLLNEPSPDPLFKHDIRLPFLAWGMLIRLALLYNHPTQSHRKEVQEKRIRTWLSELLSQPNTDILIVSHAFTMEVLSRLLVREGFTGKVLNRPPNGVLYTYTRS
ncbi:histidine phosphatase family protein [Telluribacter humicola]|uniref:histidine phosphatase family protein n=1 Tax=Telluribacter humicola TaxID=1720261 RepID=UPI001A95CBBC|nr:histidine phosphatase family protein [Telluribacter humicola]